MAARKNTGSKKPRLPSPPAIDWTITPDIEQSKVDGYPIRLLRFSFQKAGRTPLQFSLTAEDAYELREEIGKAYDQVN